jgi:ATP/maltotriose-dependent transcriptional regulator MalT
MSTGMTTGTLASAHEALRSGAWDEARAKFEAAAPSGEAYEGLGWAGYWLSDEPLTLGSRELAYRAYRAEGDPAGAGRVATWLASDHLEFRGDHAVARGWLGRAHRLLDDIVPEGEDHGWLALHEGSYAMNVDADLERAAQLAVRAAGLGRTVGLPDLEAIGLALEGITQVRRGRTEAGMRLLDEASVIARGEDLRLPISRGWALCYLISACEGVGDFPRATQWCEAVRTHADDWGVRQLVGICRSAYGNVLATNGDWVTAELELTGAVGDLRRSRPAMASSAIARLGELRARQGRVDEARELFMQAATHLRSIVGLGLLALDGGDPAAAADAAERALRRAPAGARLDQVPALELLVRARSALGDLDAAAEAYAELERAAAELGTPYVRGRAQRAAGGLAAARGDQEGARRAFEDAVDLLSESAAAYEEALARLELAAALAALGREQAAVGEREAGTAALAKLGARVPAAERGALAELTPRELEILRLVAQGLNDAEIAQRLVLSQHTVHRHVANVRTKLRLPSRTAAVAYAARAGLL